jgi:hypothetical protein
MFWLIQQQVDIDHERKLALDHQLLLRVAKPIFDRGVLFGSGVRVVHKLYIEVGQGVSVTVDKGSLVRSGVAVDGVARDPFLAL